MAGPTPLPVVVIAFLAAGALILTIGFWLGGRRADDRADGPAAPGLKLLEPAPGAVVTGGGLHLDFETAAPLRNTPAGWQAEDLHLHALLDGRELMPASSDIHPLGNQRYRWTVALPPRGAHTVELVWSDSAHRRLRSGASRAVTFYTR